MNKQPIDFSDLDADLDAEVPVPATGGRTFLDAQAAYARGDVEQVKKQDTCRSCNGTGQFRSKYTGRVVGDCFRCRGTGSVSKGTNDRVEKSRATKARNELESAQRKQAWLDAHHDVVAWIRTFDGRNEFATSLSRQMATGPLSERQVQAVRDGIARQQARQLERAAAVATAEAAGSGLDLSKVPEGRYAVPGGDTRLKVLIKKPGAPSKWAGYIFVSDAAAYGHQTRYGRQGPGKTYSGKIVDELRAIAADPRAAAVRYGQLTGTCAVCGRKLEDAESVARGIGPVCAGTF